ncbi:pancreatic secretory granule membrane major glycoprotein GP2-like [Bombina bombina]|uniref:pancreatic secretory granule membrane major glycoprotein GP2-like n=1 Tax=Bombina bombina TaxID=8345 RepID=UPI00235A51CD|nr:pancreatic secretory granule membrane major glycoprotein GP2-like [Bombina bombina]
MKLILVFFCVTLLKYAGAACYNGTEYQVCESCAGSCGQGNGCMCADFNTCVPDDCSMNSNECCPPGLFWSVNETCCTANVTCDSPCASDETCATINNKATCFCDPNFYKKKNITDLKPILFCGINITIVSLSRCLLYALGYDYNTFRLNENSAACKYSYREIVNNQSLQSIQVVQKPGWCGNIATNDSAKYYITNTLNVGIQNKTLITVNPIKMNFTCSFNITMQTSLAFALNPVLSTTYLPGINGETVYPFTMAAYLNKDFISPIEMNQEVSVAVGSYIYLGLFVTGADGDLLALRAVQCFATPTKNPDDINKVVFLSGGCDVDDEVDTVVEKNGDGLEARIRISAFAFQGLPEVYIFCNARLCDKKAENCSQCDSSRATEPKSAEVVLSLKLDNNVDFSSSSYTAVSWTLLVSSLLALWSNRLI